MFECRNPPTRLSLQSGVGAGGGRKTASPPNVPRLYGVPQPAPPGAMSQATRGGLLALQQQLQQAAGGIGRPLNEGAAAAAGGTGEAGRWGGRGEAEKERMRGFIIVNPEGQSAMSWRTARAEEQRRARYSARSWAQLVLADGATSTTLAAAGRGGAQSERVFARSPSYITMPDTSFSNPLIRNHTTLTLSSYDPSAYSSFEHDYITGHHSSRSGSGHTSSSFGFGVGVVSFTGSSSPTSNNNNISSNNALALQSSLSPAFNARSLLYATTGPGGTAAAATRVSKPGGVSASMATRGSNPGRYGTSGNPGPLGPVIRTGTALGNRREVASASHVPLPISTVSVVSTGGFGSGSENEPDFAGGSPGPTAHHAAPLGGGFAGASSNYKLRMVNHPVSSPTASGALLGSSVGGNSPAQGPAASSELNRPASRHKRLPSPSRGN